MYALPAPPIPPILNSRMESTSEPGSVHCSSEAALLLVNQAPEYAAQLEYRGAIPIKVRAAGGPSCLF